MIKYHTISYYNTNNFDKISISTKVPENIVLNFKESNVVIRTYNEQITFLAPKNIGAEYYYIVVT